MAIEHFLIVAALYFAPKASSATNDSNQPDNRFRFAADSTSKKVGSQAWYWKAHQCFQQLSYYPHEMNLASAQ